MGCDIHMYAEVRNADGTWSKVGKVFDNPWYDPDRPTKAYEDGYVFNAPQTDQPYSNRHYTLFAILADVRNGYSFAGCITHEPIHPLFPYRGIPKDASFEYRQIVEDWDCDGHSHTYATLAELQQVNWDSIVINHVGFLSEKEYNRVITTNTNPEVWCANVSGVVKVTSEAYEANYRTALENIDKPVSVYVRWLWQEKLSVELEEFINETIPALAKLGDPEDVRIVFFFDN